MDWHKAKPITLEYLRAKYSYGDILFKGLALQGALDGVLHLSGFKPRPDVEADLFVLFTDIRKITQEGQITHPVLTYSVDTINSEQSLKRLTMQFDGGRTQIEYKDDLLYLCQLRSGEFMEL